MMPELRERAFALHPIRVVIDDYPIVIDRPSARRTTLTVDERRPLVFDYSSIVPFTYAWVMGEHWITPEGDHELGPPVGH